MNTDLIFMTNTKGAFSVAVSSQSAHKAERRLTLPWFRHSKRNRCLSRGKICLSGEGIILSSVCQIVANECRRAHPPPRANTTIGRVPTVMWTAWKADPCAVFYAILGQPYEGTFRFSGTGGRSTMLCGVTTLICSSQSSSVFFFLAI